MLGCIPVMIGSALLWAAPNTKSPRTYGLVGYYFLTTFGMAYAQVMAMVSEVPRTHSNVLNRCLPNNV